MGAPTQENSKQPETPLSSPAVKTAIRAFVLSWSLTALPSIAIAALKAATRSSKRTPPLLQLIQRNVLENGFPTLVAGAFAGHHLLQYVHKHYSQKKQWRTKVDRKTAIFLSSALSMFLVRRVFPRTKTLDFTLFALVRALDVMAHRAYDSPTIRERVPGWLLDYGSVAVFTTACTEIMFAWFYAPERLPGSYSSWITKMSEMDKRLLMALRAIRNGDWKDTGMQDLLGDYAVELGLPKAAGDPMNGRIPCQIVHQGQPYGCEVYAVNRFIKGFIKVYPLYLSVHLLPPLLFRTSQLLQNPGSRLFQILKASTRSSTFLASFITIIWYSICLVRTRIGHQVLNVNQSYLDNTLAPLVGCMLCGLSLLIESPHRRGEMALYVVPRAMLSMFERVLGPHQKGRWWESVATEAAETTVFASSMAVVLDAMFNDKSHVRSSVRGFLSWIMKDELKQQDKKQEDLK
ncbi:hypothetical protein LRAMOSA10983 [Lichtheimia ramosa]|uniref:Transmembrane protein 135 N-terminal domain-containing protein n=1 Tax=Lichtheimia ramosa TaxID=688394 RepID=A0A077WRA1_9FUNG|nr:hypothetical protein LRAMOSA10983 [Lichtheimia ramosa]